MPRRLIRRQDFRPAAANWYISAVRSGRESHMENEPLVEQNDQQDEEVFLITVDEFYDLLMEQQEQM